MPDLDPKALVARVYDAFNDRDADALDELLSMDFIDHTAGEGQKPGVAGIKEVWAWIWSKHPGVRIEVEDILAEGDMVATRVTLIEREGDSEIKIGWMIEMLQIAHGKGTALWNMIRWSTRED